MPKPKPIKAWAIYTRLENKLCRFQNGVSLKPEDRERYNCYIAKSLAIQELKKYPRMRSTYKIVQVEIRPIKKANHE